MHFIDAEVSDIEPEVWIDWFLMRYLFNGSYRLLCLFAGHLIKFYVKRGNQDYGKLFVK